MYQTVQHNNLVIHSKIIMSQFLSNLEVRKRVVGCALLPANSTLHISQYELTMHCHPSPPIPPPPPQAALRVAGLVQTAKMLIN